MKPKQGVKPHLVEIPVEMPQSGPGMDVATFVGLQIRERRRFLGMTIAELAKASGISVSNLSKIETGQVSASLQSLVAIASAISTPVHALFRGFDDNGTLFHIPRDKGMLMARPGRSGGHTYELLATRAGQLGGFEPYLVTLEANGNERAVHTNNGRELLYMLSGAMEYRYGTRIVNVDEGDTLIFDCRTPHGPERVMKRPARYLALLVHRGDSGE